MDVFMVMMRREKRKVKESRTVCCGMQLSFVYLCETSDFNTHLVFSPFFLFAMSTSQKKRGRGTLVVGNGVTMIGGRGSTKGNMIVQCGDLTVERKGGKLYVNGMLWTPPASSSGSGAGAGAGAGSEATDVFKGERTLTVPAGTTVDSLDIRTVEGSKVIINIAEGAIVNEIAMLHGSARVVGNAQTVANSNGDIHVEKDVLGDVKTTNGGVTVGDCVRGDVKTSNGAVSAGTIQGRITTTSGNISAPRRT
jgi:hypothetical protein